MVTGFIAVFTNCALNYILIFGKFGAPALGAEGAAIATVISRYVECAVFITYVFIKRKAYPFFKGAFKSLYIPKHLFKNITTRGLPLLFNEFLWAAGMATLNQCYSTCGLDVVPAANINSAIYNLAGVGYMAMGNAVGIIMG